MLLDIFTELVHLQKHEDSIQVQVRHLLDANNDDNEAYEIIE